MAEKPSRSADCYVFCLFTETDNDKAKDRVLDIDAWEFYVVSTDQINRELGEQKNMGLKRLQGLAEVIPFDQLRVAIDGVLATISRDESPTA